MEQGFFAAAPPEEAQTLVQPPSFDDLVADPLPHPRREIIVRLRRQLAAARRRATRAAAVAAGYGLRAWRRTALILHAAGAKVRNAARVAASRVVAARSTWHVDRGRVRFAVVGAAVVVVAFTAGRVAFRKRPLTTGPSPTTAVAAAPAQSRSNARPSADVQAPRAVAPNRRRHAHRKSVAASSPQRPVVTAFADRDRYWAREPRSAPARSTRPIFSR